MGSNKTVFFVLFVFFLVKLVCIELMCAYKEHVPAHFLHTHWLYCSVSRVNSRGLSSPVKVAWILWLRGESRMRRGFLKTLKSAIRTTPWLESRPIPSPLKKMHYMFAFSHHWADKCNTITLCRYFIFYIYQYYSLLKFVNGNFHFTTLTLVKLFFRFYLHSSSQNGGLYSGF